jgi:hypothetical protein
MRKLKKTPIFKISAPTPKQWLDVVEYAIVAFVGSAVAVWIKQPSPFTKAAAIVAISAGFGGVLAVLKGLVTTI